MTATTTGGRRAMPLALALTLILGVWMALASAPASATTVHRLVSHFNGSEAPEGPLGEFITGEALDQTSGDLYVFETNLFELGKGLVDKFDENGVYAGVQISGTSTPQGSFALGVPTGIAVDNSLGLNSGDVYVSDTEHEVVDRFSSAGAYECQITGGPTPSASECAGPSGSDTPGGSMIPMGLAVNSSGDIYVADDAHSVIDEFAPAGNYIGQIASTELTENMGTIALNSSGDLYVENKGSNVVEFNAAGAFVAVIDSESPTGVAVDPATGHVYVAHTSKIVSEYDAAGNLLGEFDEMHRGERGLYGLAVRGSTGSVYAAEASSEGSTVAIYGPDLVVPTLSTAAATNVRETGATLNGHVDPDTAHGGGEVSECEFEYGPTTSYGNVAACTPAVPYSSATDVSANVNVAPSATYHFRLKAANSSGANYGKDQTFTTSGSGAIESEGATASATSAIVRVQIDPYGNDTSCSVQYLAESDFESSGYATATSVPCEPADLGSGYAAQSAAATLTGLNVGTTYHYRFVATNAAGTSYGTDKTFVTYGIHSFAVETLNQAGQPYTQAGGHPYKLVTQFVLNTSVDPAATANGQGGVVADANLKDAQTELPPGIVGNVNATAKCTRSLLRSHQCSGATQVGIFRLGTSSGEVISTGLYNLVPPANVPAEFGADISDRTDVYIDANIKAGGDYGITAGVVNASNGAGVESVDAELWGVPAASSHDSERYCPEPPEYKNESGPCSAGVTPQPFLTNPTSCSGPQTAALHTDSWQDPGAFLSATSTLPGVTGCNKLEFPPSITVLPDTSAADTPSGVSVNLRVPQNNEIPEALATPSLKDVTVALPAGVTLNPAAANGLLSCSPAQIGLESPEKPTCPDASKVGSVEIETPLLVDRMYGSVYLAEQDNNPFGSLLALYVTAEADGALIKVAGHVEANPLTGQLTTTFDNNPQLPFSDFRLHFFGGPRAPLATPNACGSYTTTSSMTPWSAPESGLAATPSYAFQITTGPDGSPCAPQGFAPSFNAGTTSNQAGGFSPFTLTMGRNDGEQNLGTVSTAMPPGLVGALSKVPPCGETQANQGTCPAASQIGHVTVGVGAGPYPLQTPQPGKPEDPVYLTGPYDGAPFGLSIVVPAEAGPFNLDENGRPVVVRASISVNPTTAQVTVTSTPIPQMLQGIPLDVRLVNVTIDRPEFIINPTNCERMQIGGMLTSAQGVQVARSEPFQVTNCAALAFKPLLNASTQGKTSRVDGASLSVKLTYPSAPFGSQANIKAVKVDLPRQLPSRLSTLQKACPDSTFDANPASCPAASRIGVASASTPILAGVLSGPAYFVSHGGAKFPELIIVLSGENITVDLHGETFISAAGITSTTFRQVPDVPIGTFELTLPEGPDSALAANGNLCSSTLAMPTAFVAQNGATINQSTPIDVTGCVPRISVIRHSAKGSIVTIAAHVPSAGRLSVSANGLSHGTKQLRGAGTASFALTLSQRERLFLKSHPGRRLTVLVKLSFTPVHGHKLSDSVRVLIG